MKTLYTKNPDKNCYEVEPGIYGRPCHTAEQSKLRKLGWSHDINSLRGKPNGIRKDEEEGQEEVEVNSKIGKAYASDPIEIGMHTEREMWALAYEKKFGKKPHHKAKAETLRQKVEESDD